MCGRFTQKYTWRELVELYRPTQAARNLEPRYNVAPTTTIDAVHVRDGSRELVPMRWGLVPSWWKKTLKEVPSTFNARCETVAEKPVFRSAFKRTRCIIPASGYYEWRTVNGAKQPFYFSASDTGVLSIAGLWDEWKDIASGEPLLSCTMIVTEANEFAGRVHDRMPVFLAEDSFEAWLDGSAGAELLRPAPENLLHVWLVSKASTDPAAAATIPRLSIASPVDPTGYLGLASGTIRLRRNTASGGSSEAPATEEDQTRYGAGRGLVSRGRLAPHQGAIPGCR
jgi:putative SOS response-associated peptidase YedK